MKIHDIGGEFALIDRLARQSPIETGHGNPSRAEAMPVDPSLTFFTREPSASTR